VLAELRPSDRYHPERVEKPARAADLGELVESSIRVPLGARPACGDEDLDLVDLLLWAAAARYQNRPSADRYTLWASGLVSLNESNMASARSAYGLVDRIGSRLFPALPTAETAYQDWERTHPPDRAATRAEPPAARPPTTAATPAMTTASK
jgi:hypothetical protein